MMTEQETKRPGNSKRNFIAMTLLVLLLSGAAIWANIWKADRRLAEVIIEGNNIIGPNELRALAAVPANSILFTLDLDAIERRVKKNEFVKSVAVHRDLPDRIRITVEERIPVAVIALEKPYYIDAEGFILPPVNSPVIFDLPVLTGLLPAAECIAGERTRNKNVLEALRILSLAQEIDDELSRNISELRVEGGGEFVLYTAEFGIPVFLGRQEFGVKLVTFESFWRNVVVRNGADRLLSVDLRFQDQVVVRWNHSPA